MSIELHEAAQNLKVNPLAEFTSFDDKGERNSVLCSIPDNEGGIRNYTLPKYLYKIIKLFDGSRGIPEIRETTHKLIDSQDDISWTKVKKLIETYLIPRKILIEIDEQKPRPKARDGRSSYMQVQYELLSPSLVSLITNNLKWLFRKYAFYPLIIVCTSTILWFLVSVEPNQNIDITSLSNSGLIFVTSVMLLGSFIHELGHASAATFYGCKNISIGWGWYLHLFVLYTDLTEAWSLSRKRRAIVDVSGMYFQALFICFLVILYNLFSEKLFAFSALFSLITMATYLNPFIRLDGYWLVSDMLGIPNLRTKSFNVMREVFSYVFPFSNSRNLKSNLSDSLFALICVYAILTLCFFSYLMVVVYERVVLDLLVNYPSSISNLYLAASDLQLYEPGYYINIAGTLIKVVWQGMMIVVVFFLAYRILKSLIQLPLKYSDNVKDIVRRF